MGGGSHGGISEEEEAWAWVGLHLFQRFQRKGIAKQYLTTLLGVHSVAMVFFSFGSSCYQLGCTVAAVSAQQQVEHVKTDLQNITTEWTHHSVHSQSMSRYFVTNKRRLCINYVTQQDVRHC